MKAITTDFEYLPATTVEEALELLSRHKDDDYKIIAGGQSLNTMMKHRLLTPEYIIDIKGVSELDYIKYDNKEGLKIGALTTHRSLEIWRRRLSPLTLPLRSRLKAKRAPSRSRNSPLIFLKRLFSRANLSRKFRSPRCPLTPAFILRNIPSSREITLSRR
jgi:xanthine dehydrogenase iron-sulfur cluster and FAD-binding subunit A